MQPNFAAKFFSMIDKIIAFRDIFAQLGKTHLEKTTQATEFIAEEFSKDKIKEVSQDNLKNIEIDPNSLTIEKLLQLRVILLENLVWPLASGDIQLQLEIHKELSILGSVLKVFQKT